jgi:hypothetical protein
MGNALDIESRVANLLPLGDALLARFARELY